MSTTLADLMNNTFRGEITEGKHSAILLSYVYNAHAQDPANDYIRMDFQVDGDRIYTRNMFSRDISIMLSHLRRQFGQANEDIVPITFFQDLISKKTPFDIWFAYPTVTSRTGPRRVQNIHFMEPPKVAEATSDTLVSELLG